MRGLNPYFSTGLSGLDAVLTGLREGDNVVWQVDEVADYAELVPAFCQEVKRRALPLIYFRFADHPPVLPEDVSAEVFVLHPEQGFESFISEVFDVIERFGPGACYVFDCLSELAVDWYSDRMLGNFFMLTCPYLYSYDTIAYFALERNRNAPIATQAIHATAQVVIDVFRRGGGMLVQPLKVYRRHSETMYMLHRQEGSRFVPVTQSAIIAEIRATMPQPWVGIGTRQQDVWTRALGDAQHLLGSEDRHAEHGDAAALVQRLLRMMVTRDERVLRLAERYFSLEDLLDIGRRMIGTGLIGGKSVGMLLARAILKRHAPAWRQKLEVHDSFYIGSDVFYTFLVVNKCWWVRRRLKNAELALEGAVEARQRMLAGTFPRDVQEQFRVMLDYFGQSPIIVRSSSLLEDAYGNAFSGKYDSVFLANQGTPEQRLEDFMGAVQTIYASTMSREALEYRMHWGLLDSDEQMAILVQRVSGELHGNVYYPDVAGVGFSFNPFVWSPDIEPRAGFIRLVFGLGTRAVDRVDDDYTRIVSLSAPQKRPEGASELGRYAQRQVDLLHLGLNQQLSVYFADLIEDAVPAALPLIATRDRAAEQAARERGGSESPRWVLTFDGLLSTTPFVEDLRELLSALEAAYECPVDTEFTLNFIGPNEYRINLLQCRPFQVRRSRAGLTLPEAWPESGVFLRTAGPVIGHSRFDPIDRLVYVVPEKYSRLSTQDRHAVARVIGRVARAAHAHPKPTLMLIGPGRWGTTTPELGVPVKLADIATVSVLCECAMMHEGLVPDVSLGTHFFNDIVELDMLYLAVQPRRGGDVLDTEFLTRHPSCLTELVPGTERWDEVVRVIDGVTERGRIVVRADASRQDAACYFLPPAGASSGD